MSKQATCPICKNVLPVEPPQTAPFCSSRCQQVDFFRWSEGRYAIVDQLDPVEAQLRAMEGDVALDKDPDS